MQDSIKLAQLSDGYRYNSDSLLLADFVLEMGIKNQVLEVGSGCGIIGILLKKF
ncbi:methyltransferase, partial [Campylobacter coli]|nr:methyltransferase [Campylobacter coli]EFP0135156.1 methyltransferase [Campylobacter coli]EKC9972158.1 methyltransferase [Campylobacter coli]ELB3532117.1 methyltransferase [Campylobacter coli]ELW8065248.1 methyltransferase [Campylobacter coli]